MQLSADIDVTKRGASRAAVPHQSSFRLLCWPCSLLGSFFSAWRASTIRRSPSPMAARLKCARTCARASRPICAASGGLSSSLRIASANASRFGSHRNPCARAQPP